MKVDEPEPGRVMTESDTDSSLVTKYDVTPKEGGVSLVEIATHLARRERHRRLLRAPRPRVMHSIYEDELTPAGRLRPRAPRFLSPAARLI